MHEDAERIARRFYEVAAAMGYVDEVITELEAEKVFDEMLRSEVIFGGPSLYAESPV